ncbi:hypothetical protein PoB_000170300 [Plakobranchus ocellatus]|uniref:Uncharacterized protein n=1 Tax=Plakobranchus ocellatus TaxID=259542 RepID=A0AAV3XXW4_9GAST|nr:hypothetical protein PoB_000170300 [Plakobranchus ocellatus]
METPNPQLSPSAQATANGENLRQRGKVEGGVGNGDVDHIDLHDSGTPRPVLPGVDELSPKEAGSTSRCTEASPSTFQDLDPHVCTETSNVCPGHERALSIQDTVQTLDIKEESESLSP